jgi:hypothetical protein
VKFKQSGISVIEIAITMAIVSLLFTLTVKVRELVENSHSESLARNFRDIQTELYGYKDQFHPMPKNDRNTSAHLAAKSAYNGNGNLRIEGKLDSALGETYFLWQHVKPTGGLQGAVNSAASGYVLINSTSDTLGLADISGAPISGMSGDFIICSDNISGRLIQQLDMMMDDGNTATGSMLIGQAPFGGEPIPGNNIIENDSYLACLAA